jgi:tRNA pseudouridine32 synthase/23S rRNA pseudouridine746 synthase
MTLPIVFESEFLLAVDKPHGWLTTPARERGDPRPCLGRELQKQVGKQIFPVHRLDFEVAGLTLWAKDPRSHSMAQSWFEDMQIDKIYEAYSQGGGEPPSTTLDWRSQLAKGKRRAFTAEHGKPSLTHARVTGIEKKWWKWELRPVTGRPHQLRVEMARHGYPIVGDVLYGGHPVSVHDWIALRAVELGFQRISSESRLGLPEVLRTTHLILPLEVT